MATSEQVLSIVKIQGPVLPAQIAKAVDTNILFASAHLSELVDRKLLKLSYAKVGGSPLYYSEGQEKKLEEKVFPNLNDKDKRAFQSLKDIKLLEDEKLEPILRVAMRNLKDFAIPINVTHNNLKRLFWKWHLIPEAELQILLKENLQPQTEPQTEPQTILQEVKEEKTIGKEILEEPKPFQEEIVKPPIKEEITKIKETPKKKQTQEKTRKIFEDNFLESIMDFLNDQKIEIVKQEVIRKGAEIDLIINIPSGIGKLKYYCKTKNKKRISDSDISQAFIQGQLKKMPTAMIITGDLTKKAKELLENDEFKGMIIKKWEQI